MSRISMMYSPLDSKGNAVSYTKTFLEDGTKKSYGNAWKSYIKDIDIDTISELREVINLCEEVDGCLTGGQPIKDYSFRIRRLLEKKEDYIQTIKTNTQFSVLVIDVDNKPNPYSYKDFDNHLGYILTQLEMVLPECLDTDFIYQLSSSAGTRDTSNCHLFFLLDSSHSYSEISHIFSLFNEKAKLLGADIRLDNSVNTRTQPIYVTNPIFEVPSQNPISKRVFEFISSQRQLSLPKWILEPKIEEERGQERTLELNELITEITDWHREKAVEIATSDDSIRKIGKFVKFLKLKKYTLEASEALWDLNYNGENYTLVESKKHKYHIFKDTWLSIPFEEPDYFKIEIPIVVSTDTRDNCCIVPNWGRKTLIKLSQAIIEYKNLNALSRLPKASIKLDSKVSEEIREHIEGFSKDNMLRWRII